eukprot:3442998-Alexandrium_andersonii.AAC.1
MRSSFGGTFAGASILGVSGRPHRCGPPPSQTRGGLASRRIWQVHLARIHFACLRAYGLVRDCLCGACGGLCPSAAR